MPIVEKLYKMITIWIHKRKCLIILLCLMLWGLLLISLYSNYIPTRIYYYFHPNESLYCYRVPVNSLPDISDMSPRLGKSIFFHETSCTSFLNGKITITARQACAVESAAKMNPNMDVYLLYNSPGIFKFEGDESDDILKALLTYRNIKIMHLDIEKYTFGTPVEKLFSNRVIDNSGYAHIHSSDVLRYLTLWKYGGIYLDLDVIVVKSLEELPLNYAGLESDTDVACGVLSFTSGGLGHYLTTTCLNDLRDHFNGREWGYNGPGVITRLLQHICGVEIPKEMINKDCQGYRVYPPDRFYPIPWWNWTMYFNEDSTETVFNLSRNSYAIHVWNKHSSSLKLPLDSQASYVLYARQYCPRVAKECNKVF